MAKQIGTQLSQQSTPQELAAQNFQQGAQNFQHIEPAIQDRTRQQIQGIRTMVATSMTLQSELDDLTVGFRRPFAPAAVGGSTGPSATSMSPVLEDLQDLTGDLVQLFNRQRALIDALS